MKKIVSQIANQVAKQVGCPVRTFRRVVEEQTDLVADIEAKGIGALLDDGIRQRLVELAERTEMPKGGLRLDPSGIIEDLAKYGTELSKSTRHVLLYASARGLRGEDRKAHLDKVRAMLAGEEAF